MQQMDKRYQAAGIVLMFCFLTLMLPGLPGFPYDSHCWGGWSIYILNHGLGHAYGSDTNYLPFYQYFLWAFARLAGSEKAIAANVPYLRCFTLLFELGGLWMVWKWAQLKIDFLAFAVICMLNIAYSYNTMVWGQVDAIAATLVFAMLYAAHSKQLLWSSILLVLALNMKLQAIVFVPVWGLLVLAALIDGKTAQKILKITGVMAATQLLVLLPFIMAGIAGVKPIWNVLRNASGFFPQLSMNAYNLWFWVVRKPINVKDTLAPFAGISYKNIGLSLFMLLSLAVLWPLMAQVFRAWKKKQEVVIPKEQVWLAASLIALLFFFCNTEMHERYSHPAFIFLTAYAFCTRRFAAYILFSIAYFLNMEGVLHWLRWPPYQSFLFDGRFVAALFASLILYLFVKLFYPGKAQVLPSLQAADAI